MQVECGTWQYWLTVLSPLAIMLLVGAAARRHTLWKAGWKRLLGLKGPGDVKWDAKTTLVYPSVCILAGVIAGLLGLGGGLVLAPLMLELGVNPSVSAASTQVRTGEVGCVWACEGAACGMPLPTWGCVTHTPPEYVRWAGRVCGAGPAGLLAPHVCCRPPATPAGILLTNKKC